MERVNGIIINMPKERVSLINDYATFDGQFSEPIPWFTYGNKIPLLCFIFESGVLTHISLGKVGRRAGTELRRINLYHIVRVHPPLLLQEIVRQLPEEMGDDLRKNFMKGGLLPQDVLYFLIKILIKLAPDARELLLHYSEWYNSWIERLSFNAIKNLTIQKEALLTAFLVAGQEFDKSIVRQWVPSEEPTCFLDGLKEQRCYESQYILQDFQNFPGFSALSRKNIIKGVAVFGSPSEKLTVIYADKLPLEELTGADLIYYNETYKSFVFVQYKMLDSNEYRPDRQFYRELDRIRTLLRGCSPASPKSWPDFRLHKNPFFLKFCPRIDFVPENLSLSKGMYIPLEYWDVLDSSGQLAGERGGKRLGFDNIGRYLSNTEFAVLVAKGWVGSDPGQSGYLGEIIKQTLESGRAVIYAAKESIDKIF